jgi:hypothetical protein
MRLVEQFDMRTNDGEGFYQPALLHCGLPLSICTSFSDKKDPGKQDAYQKIETLPLSPVLHAVLCQPTNFSLNFLQARSRLLFF